jgi:hypothetical protein
MRTRVAFAATVAILAMALVAPPGASAEPDGQESASAFAGICLDGRQPVNNRCCIDHDCRRSYPAIGTLPSGTYSRSTSLSGTEQSETTAGDPNGSGSATIVAYPAKAQVCFSVSHSNIEPTQAGHVHFGPRRANGPPVVNLYTSLGVSSSISGCAPADAATIDGIIGTPSDYYVQLHNAPYPLGAVRGQLGD